MGNADKLDIGLFFDVILYDSAQQQIVIRKENPDFILHNFLSLPILYSSAQLALSLFTWRISQNLLWLAPRMDFGMRAWHAPKDLNVEKAFYDLARRRFAA
jgi:hypothetical protein